MKTISTTDAYTIVLIAAAYIKYMRSRRMSEVSYSELNVYMKATAFHDYAVECAENEQKDAFNTFKAYGFDTWCNGFTAIDAEVTAKQEATVAALATHGKRTLDMLLDAAREFCDGFKNCLLSELSRSDLELYRRAKALLGAIEAA